MAGSASHSTKETPEEELAVAELGWRDAHAVDVFLTELTKRATFRRPLTRNFLLHLGAALRLLTWESQGFSVHRDLGLPAAHDAIRDALLSLNDPAADSSVFWVAVFRLSIERFAWNAPRELVAHVVLGDMIDDSALDVLADLLWASRHNGPVAESPNA
jgi:hypothetical protein